MDRAALIDIIMHVSFSCHSTDKPAKQAIVMMRPGCCCIIIVADFSLQSDDL